MKFAIFLNSQLAAPALQMLYEQDRVASVIIDRHTPSLVYLTEQAASKGIPSLIADRADQGAIAAHLSENRITAGLIYCFPYKFSPEVIQQLEQCFLNFHFGLLPEHRGPDPIFWQIKNNEPLGGLSVHHVTEKLDRGDLVYKTAIPLQKGETYGSHLVRLFAVSERGTRACLELIDQGKLATASVPQDPEKALYEDKPDEAARRIDWTQPAELIDAQVRACNPIYLGASTQLNGLLFIVLETSVVSHPDTESSPGTVLNDPQQLIIRCGGQSALALNVVQTDAGVYSGARLKQLSLAPFAGQKMQ